MAVLLAPLLLTQGSFEGTLRMRTIELQLEEAGLKESWLEVSPATLAAREDVSIDSSGMQMKGGVMRMVGPDAASGYGLLDLGRHAIVMVDPSTRSYFEFPMPAGPPPPAARSPVRPVVRALGQTRRINGVSVTGYEYRAPDLIIRGWVTKDFPGLTGSMRAAMAQMGDRDEPDEEDLAMSQIMQNGFPILVITLTDRTLKLEETVSIQPASLSADLFNVPAGFTKRTMPGGP
jgi:hypothetical protein